VPIARRSFAFFMSVTAAMSFLTVSRASGQIGPVGQSAVQTAPEPKAGPLATPPATDPPPPPRMRTIHRQVSRLPLQREYRSRPLVADMASERINEVLERKLGPIEFNETPLVEVAARLGEILGVPVDVDAQALEDLGLDLDIPLTFHGEGGQARSILRRMLGPVDLSWIVRDEVLLVTSKEKTEENLDVRLYLLPLGYDPDAQSVVDLIQSTVAADTWDTVGGPGAIRPMDAGPASQLVVSTTREVHEEVESLLRSLHEQALAEFDGPEDGGGKTPVLRLHHVADPRAREDLAAKLPEVCNASLAQGVDPEARVTVVGESLAVQSRSPEFHALAGQIVRAVRGEEVPELPAMPPAWARPAGMGNMGGGMGIGGTNGGGTNGGNPFCWVARAVYGATDPRWLQFRAWLTADAPRWLRDLYAARGEAFAGWIEDKPAAKAVVRLLMDGAIATRP